MYANLMTAPGLRTHVQQCIASKTLENNIACEGRLAMSTTHGHHARFVCMGADRQANDTCIADGLATYQREVGFLDLPMFELL